MSQYPMTIAAQCARARLRRKLAVLMLFLVLVGPIAEDDADAFDKLPGCGKMSAVR
jgi:hypothetical protein